MSVHVDHTEMLERLVQARKLSQALDFVRLHRQALTQGWAARSRLPASGAKRMLDDLGEHALWVDADVARILVGCGWDIAAYRSLQDDPILCRMVHRFSCGTNPGALCEAIRSALELGAPVDQACCSSGNRGNTALGLLAGRIARQCLDNRFEPSEASQVLVSMKLLLAQGARPMHALASDHAAALLLRVRHAPDRNTRQASEQYLDRAIDLLLAHHEPGDQARLACIMSDWVGLEILSQPSALFLAHWQLARGHLHAVMAGLERARAKRRLEHVRKLETALSATRLRASALQALPMRSAASSLAPPGQPTVGRVPVL